MKQYEWEIVKSLAWMVTTALTVFCAAKGYSKTPTLDLWLFGSAFVLTTLVLGIHLGIGK